MNQTRELADRKDREKAASELGASLIVEAAAGTGKTTLLVTRILNLIKSGKANLEEIVAITFTERAAAELKAKLHERLGEEMAAASGTEAEHLAETLWGLDRMQVTTIHAFCTSILKERPVEAGVDPSFTVADELTASLLSQETWDAWLAREMDLRNPVLARALRIGITLDDMHQLALNISANRDVVDYLPTPEDRDDHTGALVEDLKVTAKQLEEAARFCNCLEDKLLPLIEDVARYARELGEIGGETSRQAYVFTRMRIRSARNLGKASNWASKEHLKETRKIVGALRDRYDEAKSHIAHNTIALLAGELLGFVASYTEAKTAQGLLDFHDLLLYTRDLLRDHGHVRDYFQRRFRYILVDEFQDTDPLQAEIIFHLAGETSRGSAEWRKVEITPGKLFLVGDPKQSIYRFRRADIEMYASAKELFGPGRALSIHQNFRCTESIVDVVNRVFEDLIEVPDDGDYQPEYVALDVERAEETLPARHGVIVLYPPGLMPGMLDTADRRRDCESRSVAALIKTLAGDGKWETWDKSEGCLRPVMFRDIAILMRTQTGLGFLEQALRLYEIPYRVIGGKRFFLCEEIQHLLAVLTSIDNPNDTAALVAALRSPFFGASDEDLFLYHARGGAMTYLADADGTRLEEAFHLLRSLHTVRNRVNPVALLNTLYEETKAPVIFLLRPNGEQRVANLLKIGDIARALADRGLHTFRAFVRYLAERKDEEAEEGEAATVETGDDFVRLLTIHKAKGLEFPVVILTDLAGRRTTGETFIVDRRAEEIALRLERQELGIQTANYEDLNAYEDLRREAEERRMLYVAMTRARDLLVIPAYFTKGAPPSKSLLAYLADKIPPPGAQDAKTLEGIDVFDTSELDLDRREQPPFRIPIVPHAPEPKEAEAASGRFEEWKERRARQTEEFNRGRDLRAATEEKKIPPGTGRTDGATFGKIVHGVLERIDWAQPGSLDEIASLTASAEGADSTMASRAADMVRRTLSSGLLRRIVSADRYYKEVPFTFKENGTIVEGVIDVLFEEGGRIGIVDFKTDEVDGTGIGRRAETYRAQMETYRRAVTEVCARHPEEVILFFLQPMEAVTVPPEGSKA